MVALRTALVPILETGSEPRQDSLRVLVVDDYRDAAETLAIMLGLWGCDARVCVSGREALEVAPQFRPDVVLLEPDVDRAAGLDLSDCLRVALPDAALIAVTYLDGADDRSRIRQAGFRKHLVKPVEPERLQRELTEVVLEKLQKALPANRPL